MRAVLLLWVTAVVPAWAQTVPRVSKYELPLVYRNARLKVLVDKLLQEHGSYVPVRGPEHIASRSDTISLWLAPFLPGYEPPPEEPPKLVQRWQLIERVQRRLYASRFDTVRWAFLGNSHLGFLDTTWTRELRARLEAQFGPPTQTVLELEYAGDVEREDYIQFEYWFILNDTIPFVVMDVNGPFDRGLVVAADQQFRERLYELRESFLGELLREPKRAPYVDYFYHYVAGRWYETGYDGQRFFLRRIDEPDLARGRPVLPSAGEE